MLLLAMAAVGGVLYFYGWPWLKIGFAESAYYRQQDKREYDFYTPELLKNMPRITNDYSFEFGNISGPQAFVYGIRFYGTRDTQNIRHYLKSAGYEPQTHCDIEAECWLSDKSEEDIVTLYTYSSPDTVGVQLYRRPPPPRN
ncbi:hypothetical protein SY86_08185 [Erwinia tracheiphila]|uniref:Uncharacterized protein n=2 Tax=Erwinia tracheiphila TaxID=65700 RepID=A0A0M2KEH6_9GAMM|nr:hypothetical protein AV903_13080 [Erwinia tracheiphila]KKF37780.1 hypothetical protein SY86_08185 [Erwinia tracheiphila]